MMQTEFLIALAKRADKVIADNRFADVRVRPDGLQLTITDRSRVRKRTVHYLLLYEMIEDRLMPLAYIEKIFSQLEAEIDR
jgi:hypothetical protein